MKIEIRNRWNMNVLFIAEISDDTEPRFQMRAALEVAVKAHANLERANLADADLAGANLARADLAGAYLAGAYLAGANLADADLADANLARANLADADLAGANLARAYLAGANLADANLAGANLARANLADANFDGPKPADKKTCIANLDKVREIILDNEERLNMGVWHDQDGWQTRTCAEEAVCGTTHCLAGWLQVCSTDEKVRKMEPYIAGYLCAPVARKMFFADEGETLEWLRDRKYAEEA